MRKVFVLSSFSSKHFLDVHDVQMFLFLFIYCVSFPLPFNHKSWSLLNFELLLANCTGHGVIYAQTFNQLTKPNQPANHPTTIILSIFVILKRKGYFHRIFVRRFLLFIRSLVMMSTIISGKLVKMAPRQLQKFFFNNSKCF